MRWRKAGFFACGVIVLLPCLFGVWTVGTVFWLGLGLDGTWAVALGMVAFPVWLGALLLTSLLDDR